MIVNVDLYGVVQVDINEETGLDQDGVDRSALMNLAERGELSPNNVLDALMDEIDNAEVNQVVEVTRDDKVLLLGEGHRLLVVDSPSGG